jgi:hypothetical protein
MVHCLNVRGLLFTKEHVGSRDIEHDSCGCGGVGWHLLLNQVQSRILVDLTSRHRSPLLSEREVAGCVE